MVCYRYALVRRRQRIICAGTRSSYIMRWEYEIVHRQNSELFIMHLFEHVQLKVINRKLFDQNKTANSWKRISLRRFTFANVNTRIGTLPYGTAVSYQTQYKSQNSKYFRELNISFKL